MNVPAAPGRNAGGQRQMNVPAVLDQNVAENQPAERNGGAVDDENAEVSKKCFKLLNILLYF